VYVAGVVVMSLWGLLTPAVQGVMTRLVSASEQGQLQGANSSVLGVASLIGPLLFTQTFASFIGPHRNWHLPGAPFLLAALLVGAALVVAIRTMATQLRGIPDPHGARVPANAAIDHE
jgi:DHA1 family tetracycline resistance protein-like MFS transporter